MNIKAKTIRSCDIPVVILAGGRGTRLSEITKEIPKPMVPIGELPMLLHIMRYYSSYGHTRFVICLGYLGRVIKEYFLDIERNTASLSFQKGAHRFSPSLISRWQIDLVETGAETLTATRLARAAVHLDADHFCMTYGDGLTDLALDRELEFHLDHGKIGTIAAMHPPARFGNLELTPDGLVSSFVEKAPLRNDFVNGGYFIFDRKFLKYLSADSNESLEKRPLEQLSRDKELYAFRHSGFWQCMDTLRDVELLRAMYENGEAPWIR